MRKDGPSRSKPRTNTQLTPLYPRGNHGCLSAAYVARHPNSGRRYSEALRELVVQARREGVSARELTELTGVSLWSIYQWVRGTPRKPGNVRKLRVVADASPRVAVSSKPLSVTPPVRIHLGGGRISIELGSVTDLSAELLERLLAAEVSR